MCWGALASMNPRTAVSAGHSTAYLNRHGCVAVNFTVPPPVPVVVNGTGGYSTAGVGAATDPCTVGRLVCAGGLLAGVEFEVGDRKNGPITPTATTTPDPKTSHPLAARKGP